MSVDSKEVELKLTLNPPDFGALKVHPTFAELLNHPVHTERLVSVYFDTDQHVLREHGVTLRVRSTGGTFIQAVKSASRDAFERNEWECPIPTAQPDLDATLNTALEPLLTPAVRAGLRPIFETRIRRNYYHLADESWQIEVVFDQGEIVAGNRSVPICEIELELKHGGRAALFELARMIIEVIPAKLTLTAKADRGYRLLDDEQPQGTNAHKTTLIPGTTAARAFQTIAADCLGQLVTNAEAMTARSPEALHQVRIGVRRLRSAISLFSDIVHDGRIDWIKQELRWLNAELAPTRDLDAFLGEVMKPLREQHPQDLGIRRLNFTFNRRRLRNYKRAEKAVSSLRFCKLLVETFAWIEIGDWITTSNELARQHRESSVELYASDQLSRRRKKIKKRARQLETLDPERRHKLRIQVKKTRYATEFFASLFKARKAARRSKKLLSALKHLQTSLGGLNDVMTRNALCGEMLAEIEHLPHGRNTRDRAFAAGLVAGNQEARQGDLLSDAVKAHAQFEDIKPFWK